MLEAMASHPDESTRLAAAVFMLQPLETWPRLDEDTRQMGESWPAPAPPAAAHALANGTARRHPARPRNPPSPPVFSAPVAVLRVFADRTLNEPVFAVRRRVVNSCMHVARVTSAWPGVVEGAIGALPTLCWPPWRLYSWQEALPCHKLLCYAPADYLGTPRP